MAAFGADGVPHAGDTHERSLCQSEVASAGESGAGGTPALGAANSSEPAAVGAGIFMPAGMASLSGFGVVAAAAFGVGTAASGTVARAGGVAGWSVMGGASGRA